MNLLKFLSKALIISVLSCSYSSTAAEFEVQPFFGQMYSADLQSVVDGTELSVDNAMSYGIAFSWQDSPNGQGQLILNAVSHDFNSDLDGQEYSLDILYAHFNGVALFRQQNYVTTVSLGLGGAYFDSDMNQELYPSATLAIGTRYEFSDNLAFITELRGYASIIDNKDNNFCQDDICYATFNEGLWLETNLMIGVAVKF
ncbi:hypothetical protein tinsulaeT_26440 [Thalassotalea insulae]|uniref:Outer membrane protein beta-barrel domain-containing protein n=1 Tax=Thalassotalea insulae TaxID=2056778 RepID=A0ABQ6GUG2_9GAMM|nr:hypothetical protein [Thalassotalea insulae]GLX79304.1 hypothetical protein tinsulaeT_26440 [Thalassotalea insulae]